eukprot:CAMPEP_0174729450 /NCGR_PEP_ID=MMETSP1094-20130205/53758_1 /TAXON_ID=156173 /ORGANISM="Chrysochromulina brevifilum, Strain UTEX LB 985" /LENGTH=90 /DNA_ID=CAMNT_0015931569 /DNA_START=63 /DNA_END=332 /DNA_ORIENTATION=+
MTLTDSLDDHLATLRSHVPGHMPPIRDQNGFELAVHKSLANRAVDELHGVREPSWWNHPAAVNTRTELREARRAANKPHTSFDIDGDGFV